MAIQETVFYPPVGDANLPSGQTADVIVTDATTNASSTVATYTHRTTGTAAAGIGVALEYTTEDAGGDDQDVAIMRYVLTTATAGAEVGAVRMAIVSSGTVPAAGSEQFQFTPTGLGIGGGVTDAITITTGAIRFTGSENISAGVGGIFGNDGQISISTNGVRRAVFSADGISGSTAANGDLFLNASTNATSGQIIASDRFAYSKGADVASGGTVTLGRDGNVFALTGTTAIDYITTTKWQAGSVVVLLFGTSITVNHNTGSVPANTAAILLSGAANFAATANDSLTLCYDGANWREIARTVI